jgi:hypothetical protein
MGESKNGGMRCVKAQIENLLGVLWGCLLVGLCGVYVLSIIVLGVYEEAVRSLCGVYKKS